MKDFKDKKINLSIIIPAYNEEQVIESVLSNLKNYLNKKIINYEIIVINDGSTDRTKERINKISNIKLVNHPYNKGYGASIKTGVKNTQYDWILLFDSDGQHRPEDINNLLNYIKDYDMIIGARVGYQGPIIRQPGKKILHWTANYLVQKKMPDLNSGLRLIKKDLFLRFLHILPNGFSLSTTITLAFFKEGLNVKYIPIKINKRKGKSSVTIKDGFETLMLILRTIILFSPLRIFLPVSFFFFFLSLVTFILDIMFYSKELNISDTTILFFISSLFFFFFGLLTDQISAIRREKK